jgi:hypothetical protein
MAPPRVHQVRASFTGVPDDPAMGLLTIEWLDPLADTRGAGQPPDVASWLAGIVVDARSTATRRFVRRSVDRRTIRATVEPVGGLATVGVVALLHRGPAADPAAGSDAAAALDRLIDRRLRAAGDAANARDLQLWLEQDIGDTIRHGWPGLGRLADRHLATAQRLVTADGCLDEPLDLRFSTPGGTVRVDGTLRYAPVLDLTDGPVAPDATVTSVGADPVPVRSVR